MCLGYWTLNVLGLFQRLWQRFVMPCGGEKGIDMEAKKSSNRWTSGQIVALAATAELPSSFGTFTVVAFDAIDGREHAAIIRGNVDNQSDVLVRVHSECFTGDVMGSLRCDCRQQLEHSLQLVGAAERGIVLYLRQEGRGIGLANKIKAYALQDEGLDTVEANHALGFQDDERNYEVAAQMLKALGVTSIQLMTNNQTKVDGLKQSGINVSARIPIVMEANSFNATYLRTKREKSGHLL